MSYTITVFVTRVSLECTINKRSMRIASMWAWLKVKHPLLILGSTSVGRNNYWTRTKRLKSLNKYRSIASRRQPNLVVRHGFRTASSVCCFTQVHTRQALSTEPPKQSSPMLCQLTQYKILWAANPYVDKSLRSHILP